MKPLIIAHRGASGEAPENTLAAFKKAVEQGCDAIELDTHLSADGEMMVFHDDTLNRTTNGTGNIKDLTAAELKQFDAGSWFDSSFHAERIPLLEEVLDLVPDDIMINIEIKNLPTRYEQIEEKLLALLTKKNRINSVVISSFDHKCLQTIKQLEEEIKIGLLYNCDYVDTLAYIKLFNTDVYSLHPSYKAVYNQDLQPLRTHGLQIYAYTVNKPELGIELVQSGVTGLITDYPGMMKQALTQII